MLNGVVMPGPCSLCLACYPPSCPVPALPPTVQSTSLLHLAARLQNPPFSASSFRATADTLRFGRQWASERRRRLFRTGSQAAASVPERLASQSVSSGRCVYRPSPRFSLLARPSAQVATGACACACNPAPLSCVSSGAGAGGRSPFADQPFCAVSIFAQTHRLENHTDHQ